MRSPHRCGSSRPGSSRQRDGPAETRCYRERCSWFFSFCLYGAVPDRLPLLIQRLVGLASALVGYVVRHALVERPRPSLQASWEIGCARTPASSRARGLGGLWVSAGLVVYPICTDPALLKTGILRRLCRTQARTAFYPPLGSSLCRHQLPAPCERRYCLASPGPARSLRGHQGEDLSQASEVWA